MELATITPFGREIKKRLIDLNQSQAWLIDRVAEETGLYFDRSYLNKIMKGQLSTPKIIQAIREILDLPIS